MIYYHKHKKHIINNLTLDIDLLRGFSFTAISINQNINIMNNSISIMAHFKTIYGTLYKKSICISKTTKSASTGFKRRFRAFLTFWQNVHFLGHFFMTFFHGGSKIVFRMGFFIHIVYIALSFMNNYLLL